jgi:hypothetical protein
MLKIRAVPIDSIEPHPDNPRRGNVEAIADSLRRFGQMRPVLVQKSRQRIMAGHHTWLAAKELGWDTIEITERDVDDQTAEAYMVADNRLSDISTNDDAALMQLLDRLEPVGGLDATGYTPDDVEDLRALLGAINTEPQPFEGGHAPEPEPTERSRGAGPMPMREVVILMTVEQADDFGRRVKRLESAYGTTGVAATIREAVRRETQRLDA